MALTNKELNELLRYTYGTPPYAQDARYRELRDEFLATDERPLTDDPRVSPYVPEVDANAPTEKSRENGTPSANTKEFKDKKSA